MPKSRIFTMANMSFNAIRENFRIHSSLLLCISLFVGGSHFMLRVGACSLISFVSLI